MDNYIVSARKYRPSTFHSVVGQKSLTTTLKNAIINNKLAHAYLFCGPRGVGKTTCARIFAKTINCFNPTPEGEACNECESCVSFNENRSLNIHELDAASNNSVDDIRMLTEQVRILPQLGEYKVYIIDEVHMLSSAAFNAFLKTLEEPPHHAIFILATTEKHKILPTILSRCQIYDFSRISINDIVDYLDYVSSQEGISSEKEALNVIAQKADGGMRDALSIFDQVVSFSQGNVTYNTVINNLNVLDYDYYFRFTNAILAGNVAQCMLLLNEILSKGFDGQQILTGLAAFFRDLLVCKDLETIVLFEVGEAVKEKYVELAAVCGTQFLYKAIELANETDLNYRYSRNKRLSIELLLIRLCQLNHPAPQDDSKKKIIIEPIAVSPATPNLTGSKTSTSSSTVSNTTAPVSDVSVSEFNSSVATETGKRVGEPEEKYKVTDKAPARVSLLKKASQKEEERSVQEKKEVVKTEPFDLEKLSSAWKKYANGLDDVHLKSAMSYLNPAIKDNYRIELAVLNPEQASLFEDRKRDIKEFLFSELNNNQLDLEIKVQEDDSGNHPFTDREKYQYMAEKNPNLKRLVQEFNLRLD